MSPNEHRARVIVLAQALDGGDGQVSLVDAATRAQALRAGLRATSVAAGALSTPPSDNDRIHAHAQALLGAVSPRHPALGALVQARGVWSWLSFGIPLFALVAGMATDRIANPHRVDLLSPPLLIVVAWNLLMYLALAVTALMRQPAGKTALIAKLHTWASAQGRLPRGEAAKVVGRFYAHWHRLTEALTVYRWKKVLHLAAAAWGLGIAVSLAGRGLFVQYQIGWESTFLSAAQVQSVLKVLFWLPASLFGVAPFTLQDVQALRNFAVPSQAADSWVYLYVGLLVLSVVIPRLALAAWAAWRARRLSIAVQVDLQQPYYRCLLLALRPVHLVVGLVGDSPRIDAQLLRLLRHVADYALAQHLTLTTAEGDTLRWVEDPQVNASVDAVLRVSTGAVAELPVPWRAQPVAEMTVESASLCWAQGQWVINALARQQPAALQTGLLRLNEEWARRNTACFDQSMAAVAAFLLDAARRLGDASAAGPAEAEAALAASRDALFLKLKALHRMDRAAGDALEEKLAQRYQVPAVIGKNKTIFGANTRTGAAAGAATGATMGGAIDMATGFLSLGAGVALGSLLGAGVGWAVSAWRQKGMSGEVMSRLTQATLLLYFEVANAVRVHSPAGDTRTAWQETIARELARHEATLSPLWVQVRAADVSVANAGTLKQVLTTTTQASISALFPVPSAFAEDVYQPVPSD